MNLRSLSLATLCSLGLLANISASDNVEFELSEQGPARLVKGGHEFFTTPQTPGLSVRKGGEKFANLKRISSELKGEEVLLVSYEGMEATLRFVVKGNRLDIQAEFRNTGDAPIDGIELRPFSIRFPVRPEGKNWVWGYQQHSDTDGDLGLVSADWGGGKMALCIESGKAGDPGFDLLETMSIGFGGSSPKQMPQVNLRLLLEKPLSPGDSIKAAMSVRFAPSGTPDREMAPEVYEKFLARYPFRLNWPDRRPVGLIFLANSGKKWPTNPRGWLNNEKIDTTTPEGRAEFKNQMMELADRTIGELKRVGAQGVIIWDIEGGEMPHAITYLGDPRVLPEHAPEMNEIADEFMKKFSDAGFKTGLTIRPSKIITRPTTGEPAHQQVPDAVGDMADKIAYAKNRWGSTIFYMDTNVTWPIDTRPLEQDITRGMWQGDAKKISGDEMNRLAQLHPDVLIFPEFPRLSYYGATGIYDEARTGGRVATSARVREVYPDAMTVWKLGDVDFAVEWEGLLAGAKAGDIHAFRAWFSDNPTNFFVGQMQRELDYLEQEPTIKLPEGGLAAALASAEPAVRYKAVKQLQAGDAAQSSLLMNALSIEEDWVVKRQIILALGRMNATDAIPLLVEKAADSKTFLYDAASRALAEMGTAGTVPLLELAQNSNARIFGSALRALASTSDPAATPQLLELSKSSNSNQASLALSALAPRPGPEVEARLLEVLNGDDPRLLIAICAVVGEQKLQTAVPTLIELLERSVSTLKNNDVRYAAAVALEKITGQRFGIFTASWSEALQNGTLEPNP